MKKGVIVFYILFMLSFVCAVEIGDNIPIQIQTVDASGNIITGTFEFKIDISTSSSCTPILYSNTSTRTTDSRGIVSYNLENVDLNFSEQYWFCYYRDGVLKDTVKAARVPYSFRAKNVTLSGVGVDTNFDMSGYNITASIGNFGVQISSYALNVFGNVNITGNMTLGEKINGVILPPPTCAGTEKLSFDGTSFSCQVDETTAANATYQTYNTGWVNTSDWTNVHLGTIFNGNVTHNLNANLSELYVKVLISTDGTDANSMEAFSTGGSGDYGITIYQVDLNTFKVQTATGGLTYFDDTGAMVPIINQAYYYKIIVTKGGLGGTGSSGNASGVPSGAIMAFNSASCPTGWIPADGTSGTPDLRGIFLRGSGTSGVLKYANGSYFYVPYGTYGNDSFQGHYHDQQFRYSGASVGDSATGPGGAGGTITNGRLTIGPITDGTNGVPRNGSETNPAYYATIYCVKTTEDTPVSNSIWGTSGNNIFVQNTSLNVGIGTTTPDYALKIKNNNSLGIFTISRVGFVSYINDEVVFGVDGIAAGGGDYLWIGRGSANKDTFVIDVDNKRVGIGTTTPSSKLEVVGNTNLTGNLTVVVGSNIKATSSCDSGFTRVGLWCMDTDGNLSSVRASVSSNDSAYVSAVVSPNAEMAIIRVRAMARQDGTGGTGENVYVCVLPGDSSITSCDGRTGIDATPELANENNQNMAEFTVRTNSTGAIKTKCLVGPGLSSAGCSWFLAGYMD